MYICNKCGKPLKEGAEFCTSCGNKISHINNNTKKNTRKKSNKGPIICIILAIVVFIGILYKDTIMYNYYLIKGNNEKSASQSIGYYTKSLKLKYNEEIISKISKKIKEDDDFETTLETLQWAIEEDDLNKIYVSAYVNKAKENFNSKNYETTWSYLEKAELYGYNIEKFEYYKELIKIQEEEENTVINENSYDYDDDYIIADSDSRYLTKEELSQYSKEELAYIRNEIFARYGYIFETEKYDDYFRSKSWYVPDPYIEGNASELNKFEKANLKLIQTLEND